MVFNGSEHFIANGEEISVTMSDFWKWSYPDFLDNSRRNTLSKFIVASSIGQSGHFLPDGSAQWTPYDMLTGDGYRLQIEAASYLQSQDEEHPDFISYPINGMPDAYVFSLYKATSPSQNPLNLDLWDFFVISRKTLIEDNSSRKTITLSRLQELGVWQSDYFGISEAILKALDV